MSARCWVHGAVAVLLVVAMTGAATAAALDGYRWRARPLLVFAPDASATALSTQQRMLADAAGGVRERDVVVLWVVGDSVTAEGAVVKDRAATLRGRFGIRPGEFRVVLVGKDGGAKRSSSQPISPSELFRTIDAMPMRRDEMRRR